MSIIAPTVLPGRAFQRIDKTSKCLFHWRASDLSLQALTGQAPTFSRASSGGATVDSVGKLITPVHSQPRFSMVDLDNDGTRETPSLLLESSSTNRVPYSEDLSQWAAVTATVTPGQADPRGGLAANLLTAATTAQLCGTNMSLTGNGTKAASIFLRAGSAPTTDLSILDITTTTHRHRVRVTWSNGVPSVATESGAGLIVPVTKLADGWWRIAFAADGIVAANINRLYVYPSPAVAGGTVYVFGAQVEDNQVPSSYIRTAGSPVARDSDTLTWPFLAAPQEMSVYLRFVESGGVIPDGTTRVLLHLGSAGSPRLFVGRNSVNSVYSMTYYSDSSSTVVFSGAPSYGDISEILCTIPASGRARIIQSINGGPPNISIAGADVPIPTAPWSSPTLHLNAISSSNVSTNRYLDVKVAAGVRSLQEIREIL